MKGGAELLGVSYGTLYGRYREVFGYLKHGWNSSAPLALPPAVTSSSTSSALTAAAAAIAAVASTSANKVRNLFRNFPGYLCTRSGQGTEKRIVVGF
jgi:hypothetical protein